MRIDNISFAYGDKVIFRDYSLELKEGLYCLMGPSAIGKTTMLQLMSGILKPDQGTVDLEGRKPVIMFQEDRLLPWYDGYRNVELAVGRERKADIEKLFELLQVPLHENVRKLSGGQKRRIALIRALLAEGDLLLLDEPFNGMDRELTEKAAELIRQQNKLTIAATHIVEDAKLLSAEIINI